MKNVWWFCTKCEQEVRKEWGVGETAEDNGDVENGEIEIEEKGTEEKKSRRLHDHDYGAQEEDEQNFHDIEGDQCNQDREENGETNG
ncbi:hypothetical protein E2C01_056385 [Portunus trituberculatus]|uniref:Uncharacterized protein n=1 Tax=Portunus trituberculatus TaxID=210409 RepID=A0A5B7GQ72_PORTR|nr:hypothetical protein [Portunus trituberculatus]